MVTCLSVGVGVGYVPFSVNNLFWHMSASAALLTVSQCCYITIEIQMFLIYSTNMTGKFTHSVLWQCSALRFYFKAYII